MHDYEKVIELRGFTCTSCHKVKDGGTYKLEREIDHDAAGKVKRIQYFIELTCDDCAGKGRKTRGRGKK